MTAATSIQEPAFAAPTTVPPDRDRAFGERLRAREPEALERFFDAYFGPIHGLVRRLVSDRQEAEDLTQEIFLKIHRALPSFDPERRLGPWVYAIARNRIRDHWRARRTPAVSVRDGDGAPAADVAQAEVERRELDDEVKKAVYRLPLGMRSVLLMRIYDELPFQTIAAILKLTPVAARKRYSRAVQLLRGSLPLEGARP